MSNRVVPAGSVNLNSTLAPGLLVLESLNGNAINGVNTNLIGAVGTASYGPVNSPVLLGSITDSIANFGNPVNRQFDIGTFVNVGGLQGPTVAFYAVRVTDGTDTSAVTRILDTQNPACAGAVLSAKYTGTTGNTFQVNLTAGSAANTFTLTIGRPGYAPEAFTNIGGSGATFWTNLINAINNGQSGLRGPSQLVTASVSDEVGSITVTAAGTGYTHATVGATGGGGSGFAATATITSGGISGITITNRGTGYTSPPTISITGDGTGATATATLGTVTAPNLPGSPYTFSGGTDGVTSVTTTTLLGSNGNPRTGMYALANTNVSLFSLVDCSDSTTFTDQVAFAGSAGSQAVGVGPSGQSYSEAVTALSDAGIDSTSFIYLVGDYCNYLDTFNSGIVRLIPPQGYYAGLMGNLSPEQDPLNKQIYGIISTQSSQENRIYSDAEIEQLMQNGIDVIAKPSPGGNYFAPQTGKAAAQDLSINDVYIQRMANYLALSLSKSGVLGAYISKLQTPDAQASANNAISSFLQGLEANGQIQAFSVVLNSTNNPSNRVQLGFMTATVSVQLFSAIIVFVINLDVGTTSIQSIQPVTPQ